MIHPSANLDARFASASVSTSGCSCYGKYLRSTAGPRPPGCYHRTPPASTISLITPSHTPPSSPYGDPSQNLPACSHCWTRRMSGSVRTFPSSHFLCFLGLLWKYFWPTALSVSSPSVWAQNSCCKQGFPCWLAFGRSSRGLSRPSGLGCRAR